MMAKRTGKVGALYVSEPGATPSWQKVGRVVDATFNFSVSEIDVSDQDSTVNEYLRGRGDFTIDGTLRYDPQDAGQQLLEESAFEDGEEANIMVRWRSKEGAGEKEYVAEGFVTAWNITRPDEAPQDVSFTIRLTQKPTRQDQSV